jgi:TolA-binding protein
MFKIKKEKVALTNPAQVIGSMGQVSNAARENVTGVIIAITVAVVVAVAVGGYLWLRQQEDRAAEDLFHEGMRIYSQSSPVAPLPRPEQLQKSVETFRKVLAEYPRSSAAPQAAYMLGNALSDLKDWTGAVKAYEDFLTRYRDRKALVPLVYQRLAFAQLSQGRLDDAVKTLETLTKMPGALNKDRALYELAKIDEILNRPEGALARYQELIKDHPQSPYAEEASVRVKTMDARKAVPPAPASGEAAPSAPPAPSTSPPAAPK